MTAFTDDNGNKSSMRLIFAWVAAAFIIWNTLMICVHLFIKKGDVSEIFSGGYLNWNGEMLGILLGGKSVQKGIEVAKDILISKKDV